MKKREEFFNVIKKCGLRVIFLRKNSERLPPQPNADPAGNVKSLKTDEQ